MMISKPGIYEMDAETYHNDPCIMPSLSSSGAKRIMEKSAYHYWYESQHGTKETPALRVGAAAHMAVLEPERFAQHYYVLPEGFNPKFVHKQSEEIEKANAALKAGKTWIKGSEYELVQGLADGMARKKDVLSKFMACPTEQSGFWFDNLFNIWRRVRFDWLPTDGRIFADYKTVRSCKEEDLQRAFLQFGWFQQAAWYLDGIRALGLHDSPVFLFILQEKEPPYELVTRHLNHQDIMYGRIYNAKAMDLFARGVKTGKWDGYDPAPKVMHLPQWAERQIEDKMEMGAFALNHAMQADYFDPEEIKDNQDG